ncbi:MAG: type II toxin-antitoxin system VapC family toxin [Smithellaceae bacterium]|nr:type II toxin-antitoxin system VapC family toxin [Smithellaceae bacterium]
MILLDTCVLVYDALAPNRLTAPALRAIEEGDKNTTLYCSDISLWEIAMLISKGRLDPGTDTLSFLKLILSSRMIRPLAIIPEIAQISSNDGMFIHHDPADRIIAATALHYRIPLVTSDASLKNISPLTTIW